jgi:hypothetical protein
MNLFVLNPEVLRSSNKKSLSSEENEVCIEVIGRT